MSNKLRAFAAFRSRRLLTTACSFPSEQCRQSDSSEINQVARLTQRSEIQAAQAAKVAARQLRKSKAGEIENKRRRSCRAPAEDISSRSHVTSNVTDAFGAVAGRAVFFPDCPPSHARAESQQ
jgi:hypothetical protein